MIDFYTLDTQAMKETTVRVGQYFRDERYVDPNGVVWVGSGEAPDEVWVVESGSDDGYMTKDEMLLKMVHEISEKEAGNA